MIPVYVSQDGFSTYYAVGEFDCDKCGAPLFNSAFLSQQWCKRDKPRRFLFCPACVKDHSQVDFDGHPAYMVSIGMVQIAKIQPPQTFMLLPFVPDFSWGKIRPDPWDNPEGAVIDDQTLFAGREDWSPDSSLQIGAPVETLNLEERDRELLDENEAFLLLKELQRAPDSLEYDKKRLLESEKDE